MIVRCSRTSEAISKKLAKLIHQEWKRSRGQEEVMPGIPERIGYLRRLPSMGRPLDA